MKKTVGAASLELQKKSNEKYDAYELQREMTKNYLDEVIKAAKSVDWEEPYYVCVQCKKERLLKNVIRNYFYARKTRPLPDYDLTLFSYDPKTGDLKFEWTIPDPDTCLYLMHTKTEHGPDHGQLIHDIELFSDGKLV